MKKSLSILIALAFGLCARAISFPIVSTDDSETWYFIQFTSGGAVIADKGEGSEVRTATIEVTDGQMWKITGNDDDGYMFTNKLGRTLYVTAPTQNTGFFRAATEPASDMRFAVTPNDAGNGFLIAPMANKGVFMNQWQGAGTGKRIGLWNDRNDAGSMVTFADAAILDPASAIPLIPHPVSLTRTGGTVPCDGIEGRVTTAALEGLDKPSAYELSITAEGVTIRANDDDGLFYARQTLRQLVETSRDGTIPCLEITDYPRFAHRGYMLDVARHFFNKDEVKQVLDIMARYKLNVFHWHLTDDQGWRIEIPEYPRLTEVGAIRERSFTNVGLSTTFYDDTEYGRGCYFTLDDLREIVAYAAERHITIIPEIDMPGHMVAALASYPELSCDPSKKYSVRIDSGISHDILDISNPETIKFLKCVLGHVAEVFPGKLIHIGGDECPTENWQASASCKAFAAEKGITVDQLQGWLVEELGEWLRDEYGKDIVVWDELLNRWPDSNQIKPVIMAWNSIGKSADAANRGMQSIIVPYQYLYLDFMQQPEDKCDVNEGYQGGWGPGWVNSLDKIYNLNPTASLGGREEYALGPQGNMWAETCCNFSQVLYQLLPRGLALAEIGWTPNSAKNWLGFLARLQSHDEVFEAHGWAYAKHFFDFSDVPADRAALKEARQVMAATHPGCAGYVAQDVYDDLLACADALEAAMAAGADTTGPLAALNASLEAFKAAPVVQPDPDKIYQIESASTWYKALYDGATVYVAADGSIRFHYTPQIEPEELWQMDVADDGSMRIRSFYNLKCVMMPNAGSNLKLSASGSPMLMTKATTPNAQYTYVPGSVLLQRKNITNSMFFADATGYVKNQKDVKLCCQGTWRLREVTDYALLLERLVAKCRLMLLRGQLTDKQADRLLTMLITPAEGEVDVTRDTYDYYVDIYAQCLGLTRKGLDAVTTVVAAPLRHTRCHDLQGRPATDHTRGIVITPDGRKIVR